MRPSSIPMGGRALRPEEQAALVEEMTAIVEHSHLFKSLDAELRGELLESGYVTSYEAGDVVFRQGDPGELLILVMRGRVRVETATPGGTVQLAELGSGACVGEVSVLTGAPRTATVVAIDAVDAVAFAKHRIERILDRSPKVRKILESLVDLRARDTIEKIIG
ncbi:MAG: cyclic nucleotide-binding domain-containing protein [Sandaracinus sp.]|nr:cyclic nucleotide-binding domain-containing protein [Myxococcales bacterium]MCB9598866.1 cyclic nucleotide-binding domain-containing protein [Sandaracinus sp.]MCB9613671.1 cyclic nucleotide-binding domain-containing protein [Sandaracinus sp.]MCB9621533.1 cyclic nucleotide-binding domain-containing protein [Sandaracinus sp.]